MAIEFKKYVDITSGVGAGASVRTRDLIGRLYTTNPAIPTGTYVELTDIADAGTLFGIDSEEYKRTLFYMGWISKAITRAKMISFARWTPEAVAPLVIGGTPSTSVPDWALITDGAFFIDVDGTPTAISALDFTGVTSLTEVAQKVQTGINAKPGNMFTTATVTWDASGKRFILTGGQTGVATMTVTAATTGTDISGRLGWIDATFSDGANAETPPEAVVRSTSASNNYGSFLFIDDLALPEATAIAQWNHAQNVAFMYTLAVKASDMQATYDALKGYSGVAITAKGKTGEYHEMAPMIVLAATDYTRRNAVKNYMYQQFALTPTVTETSVSNAYDALRVNYYGRTQTAGQTLDFYQRGVLMGDAKAPVDMNTYANEQWLKDAAGAEVMSLLLAMDKVSANVTGRSQLISTVTSVAEAALFNGTISVGKALNNTQRLYITDQTGDPLAWHQVQNTGWWLDCTIQSYTTQDGRVEYKATYLLMYSKDDVIRKVEGTHTLI